MQKEMLNLDELASVLNISKAHASRLKDSGTITVPPVRFGRSARVVAPQVVRDWIAAGCPEPAEGGNPMNANADNRCQLSDMPPSQPGVVASTSG